METEINSILDLFREEYGEEMAIAEAFKVLGERLAMNGLTMAEAMDLAEDATIKGWYQSNNKETINEEI